MNINNSIIKSIHNTKKEIILIIEFKKKKKEKNVFIDVQKKVTNIKV